MTYATLLGRRQAGVRRLRADRTRRAKSVVCRRRSGERCRRVSAGALQGQASELWLIRAVPGRSRESYAARGLEGLTDDHKAGGAVTQRLTTPVHGELAWIFPLLWRLGFTEESREGQG